MSIVLVPGLRGPAPEHWQEVLAGELGAVHLRTDREPLDLTSRMRDIEDAVVAAGGPVVLVAHSAGVLTAVHWAMWGSTERVACAVFVTPPALHHELPAKYPRRAELRAHGWLPIPVVRLPFPTRVVVSDNDDLGPVPAVAALAEAWGAEMLLFGAIGHANPDSGFGPWPAMAGLLAEVDGRVPW